MKIVSWNVNGIRSALKKGALEELWVLDADIICLQEVRATPLQFELKPEGYNGFWNPALRKGYSGTGILSRLPFKKVTFGMQDGQFNEEGRVITAELDDYYIVTVYTPNSGRGLVRLDYRVNVWDAAFAQYLKELEKKKPVIFCGDLNVAHKEIDLTNPSSNTNNAGFTIQERDSFSALLNLGFVDTFRFFCSDGGHYTWWSNFNKARERNIGWRIDYFCVSENLKKSLKKASIHQLIMGSDHCPVSLEI